MYQNQEQYQYQQQQPPRPAPQQQGHPQNQPPQPLQAALGHNAVSAQQLQHHPTQAQAPTLYQGYAYPPVPHAQPSQQYMPTIGSSPYVYSTHPFQGYYYNTQPYQSAYPGQVPLQGHQNPFSGAPYPPPPPHMQPRMGTYPPQSYGHNGYYHPESQQHFQISASTRTNPPPTKRQKVVAGVEPKEQLPNASHNHKQSRPSSRDKNTFSDFRVRKIKVGNFTSDESRLDSDVRDSRLRFYFRSPSSHPSPRPALTPMNIAAQCPDRLSVSLHKGTHRIVIPATHLWAVCFDRAAGYLKVKGDGWAAFEEARIDESRDSAATLNDTGAGPKFVGTDVDPTGGEWQRAKVMEIWLDTNNPLTEPKWARGNLRDTLDPTSLFQNIITFADPHAPTVPPDPSLEETLRRWRDHSELGPVDLRSEFLRLSNGTNSLVQLLIRMVYQTYGPLEPTVTALLRLIPDKEAVHDELLAIVLAMPGAAVQRAMQSIIREEMTKHQQGPRSHSGSSANPGNKRERDPEGDEDMEVVSNSKTSSVQLEDGTLDKEASVQDKDTILPDHSTPTSAVDHDEARERGSEVPAELSTVADEDLIGSVGDDIGMDFKIPEEIDELQENSS